LTFVLLLFLFVFRGRPGGAVGNAASSRFP
jgi:hypothetical protein